MAQSLTGTSRVLKMSSHVTVSRSVAFCATSFFSIFHVPLASAGGSGVAGSITLDLEYDQSFPGTIRLGYRIAVGAPLIVLQTIPKPAGSIVYGSVPAGSQALPYEIITWSAEVRSEVSGTLHEWVTTQGGGTSGGPTFEALLPGTSLTAKLYVNDILVRSYALGAVSPTSTVLGDSGAAFYAGNGVSASATTILQAVSVYVRPDTSVASAVIPALATGISTTFGITIPHMPTIPGIAAPFNTLGSATQNSVAVVAPSIVNATTTATSTLTLYGIEDTRAIIRIADTSGGLDPTPQDVYVDCGGQTFKMPNVVGSAEFSQKLGGTAVSVSVTGPGGPYTATATSHPLGPTGAPLTPRIWPYPRLSRNPAGYTGAVVTDALFEALLPYRGGGLSVTLPPAFTLHGDTKPWVLGSGTPGGFFVAGNASLSITGGSNQYLRYTATLATSNSVAVLASQFFPYRFITIRCRSVGSANRNLFLTLNATVPAYKFTTGADGVWIEAEIDLMLANAAGVPTDTPTHKEGAQFFASMTTLAFSAALAGVYEFEWIKAKSRGPAELSFLRPVPDVATGAHGLPALLGIVDGWVGLGSPGRIGTNLTAKTLAAAINAYTYNAWQATAVPVRGGKAFPFTVDDLGDSDSFVFQLGGGGVFSDGKPAWGISAGAVLQNQVVGLTFSAYPGFTGFISGNTGDGYPVWQAITRSDAVAIGTTTSGEMVKGFTAVGTITGTTTASGTGDSGKAGLARIGSPDVQRGDSLRVTVKDATTAWWGIGSAETRIVGPTDAPYDYYDFRNFVGGIKGNGRYRAFLLYLLLQQDSFGMLAVDDPRQWIYAALGKRLGAFHISTTAKVFQSIEHPVGEWLSLCYDTRSGYLYALARIGAETSTTAKVYRSRDGGRTIKDLLTVTGKSFRLERGSERQWLVLIYQDADSNVQRRLSQDAGDTWDAATAILEGTTALSGTVLDLEQDSRAAGAFFLALGDRSGAGDGDVDNARFYRSQDSGLHWKSILTNPGATFALERDSERQWLVMLRESSDDGTVERHLSQDVGKSWITPVPAMAGEELLTGKVIDMEQSPRANGVFFLSLGEVDEDGVVIKGVLLRSFDAGINWQPIERELSPFKLGRDALGGPHKLA